VEVPALNVEHERAAARGYGDFHPGHTYESVHNVRQLTWKWWGDASVTEHAPRHTVRVFVQGGRRHQPVRNTDLFSTSWRWQVVLGFLTELS
jgi:hypothetical protein